MKLSDISETMSGVIATSMGKGNGFANGGPGMRRRTKKNEANVSVSSAKSNKQTANKSGGMDTQFKDKRTTTDLNTGKTTYSHNNSATKDGNYSFSNAYADDKGNFMSQTDKGTTMGYDKAIATGLKHVAKQRMKKESVYDMNKDDPNNPEVLIQGYGRMNMDTLKNALKGDLKVLYGKAKADDWEYIAYMLSNSPFSAKLKALMDAMEELEGIRRKGGPKSRGINKR